MVSIPSVNIAIVSIAIYLRVERRHQAIVSIAIVSRAIVSRAIYLRVECRRQARRGVEVLGLCRCAEQRSHGLEIGASCREVQQGETCAPDEGRFGRGVAPAQRALEPSHRRLPLLHLLRRASFRLSLRIGYYHYRWYVHLSHLVGRGQVGEELVGEGQVRTEEAVVA